MNHRFTEKFFALNGAAFGREGTQRLYTFPNGYGASVIRFRRFVGGKLLENNRAGYSSYTRNEQEWEVAVIRFNKNGKWNIVYDTPITDDVIGYVKDGESLQTLLNSILALKRTGGQRCVLR